jgi:hypothetical protein
MAKLGRAPAGTDPGADALWEPSGDGTLGGGLGGRPSILTAVRLGRTVGRRVAAGVGATATTNGPYRALSGG